MAEIKKIKKETGALCGSYGAKRAKAVNLSGDEMEEMSLSKPKGNKKSDVIPGRLEPLHAMKLSTPKREKTKKEEHKLSTGSKAHPGFKAVEKKVEKEGYGKKAAGAIVASAARNASAKAHKSNPKLNKVKGK